MDIRLESILEEVIAEEGVTLERPTLVLERQTQL
jgi:hypothetical protein